MIDVDLPTADTLNSLVEERTDACASIYLPTHPVTQPTDVDRLELRRLAETASGQLRVGGFDKQRPASLEASFAELGRDHDFWRFQIQQPFRVEMN